jgi:hypothetical protein
MIMNLNVQGRPARRDRAGEIQPSLVILGALVLLVSALVLRALDVWFWPMLAARRFFR